MNGGHVRRYNVIDAILADVAIVAVGRCSLPAVRKLKNSRCAAVSAAMSTANDGSAVRFGRWWWCWRRRRRSSTTARGPTMPTTTEYPRTIVLLTVLALVSVLLGPADAAARTKAEESASPRGSAGRQKEAEPVIEEVTAKQLERLLNEKDFVAVYWCKCADVTAAGVARDANESLPTPTTRGAISRIR